MDTPNAFISYRREDLDRVVHITDKLSHSQITSFIDKEAIHSGEYWERRLERAISESDVFVLFVTSRLVSDPDSYTLKELNHASKLMGTCNPNSKFINIVMMDDCDVSGILARAGVVCKIQWVKLYVKPEDAVLELVGSIYQAWCKKRKPERLPHQTTLPADDLLLLKAIALFPDPISREALQHLVRGRIADFDRSLNQLSKLEAIHVDPETGLYSVTGAVRALAGEKLVIDEDLGRDWTLGAADYFLKFASAEVGRNDPAGLDRLDSQMPNVVWAAEGAFKYDQWQVVLRYRKLLDEHLRRRGHRDAAIRIGTLAFDAAEKLGNVREQAWSALYPLARVNIDCKHDNDAVYWATRALELFSKDHDEYGMAQAHLTLGQALDPVDHDEAEKQYKTGLEIARTCSAGLQEKNNLLGHLFSSLAGLDLPSNRSLARQRYQSAYQLYNSTGNRHGIADTLHRLGDIALEDREFPQAREWYEKGLEAVRGANLPMIEAELHLGITLVDLKEGKIDEAREAWDRARALAECSNDEELSARIAQLHKDIWVSADTTGRA